MENNEANKLATYVSSAEYSIVTYLKEHPNCTDKELMPHVIYHMSIKASKKGEITHRSQPIHTLAYLIAVKELEAEGLIQIERGTVPFPMIDFKSIFSLVKPLAEP